MSIVHLTFQHSPKAFHRAIINAVCNSGHTLLHMGILKPRIELPACILESPVAVEQRMCVRLKLNSLIKGVHHQWIIVMVTDLESHDSAVIQVEDGAQIDLLDFYTSVVLKLGYVRQPLLVRCLGVKFSMQVVFGDVVWVTGILGATLGSILYTGMNLQLSLDIQDPFVIDLDVTIYCKLITDSAVSHIWMLAVNLPDFSGDFLILKLMFALRAFQPFVIRGSCDMQVCAQLFNRIMFLFGKLLDSHVFALMPD